jgi:transposase
MLWQRGKSYSQDLRERVFAAADDGEPVGRIATMLRVSVSYVSKVLSRRRLTGQTQARPQCCHVVPKLSGLLPAIEAQVSRHPDATIAELRAWLLETHKVSASTGLINKTLAALDLTFKKRMARPVCKDKFTGRAGLHQRIRSQGLNPGQDGMRAPRA